MKQVIIVGGGIIGLSSAYYLQQAGCSVTVLDKDNFQDNCSYGNAGYVCPSHFIPLATPGIVQQGLRWMLNAKSPFYVQPRWDRSLIDWGMKFIRSAKARNVEAAARPLRDIALISQREYETWSRLDGFDFSYEHKGLLEIFQTQAKADHAAHIVEQALSLGLDTQLLSQSALRDKEPQTTINAKGAIFFKCDAHLYPNRLMRALADRLKSAGVRMLGDQSVRGFEFGQHQVKKVITATGDFDADEIVLAAGSWSRAVAALLGTKIPLVGGRGYSVTLEDSQYRLNHPCVLAEGRVAITPMDGNKIRFGGTMEITSLHAPPRLSRVRGILDSVRRFFPEFDVPMPAADKIWFGYRPCSADGLPYIGRISKYNNVVVATGHSMLGLSLGAGTGKLVEELVNRRPPSMDMGPFAVERFAR